MRGVRHIDLVQEQTGLNEIAPLLNLR
jgi:hypothetical protein